MKTQIFSSSEIDLAAALLKEGELVAFPTETVYGLGACVFNESAVQKIFTVKGRPSDNPLIVHIAHLKQLPTLVECVPEDFFILAHHFFPGPLTLVIRKHPKVPQIVSGGLDTIAIRQPAHPIAISLIEKVGQPLVAPSANLSGKPSPTLASHVLEDLEGKISGVLDGGACRLGIESTVVDLVSFEHPTILRPGEITASQLEEVLRKKVAVLEKTDKKVGSPGMKYRHYAPQAVVKAFYHLDELKQYMASAAAKKPLLLSRVPLSLECAHQPLSAQKLYASLRFADEHRYDEIVLFLDEEIQKQHGLMNRIRHVLGQNHEGN